MQKNSPRLGRGRKARNHWPAGVTIRPKLTMTCAKTALVPSFVRGGLASEQAQDMRAHIEQCEICFMEVAAAAALISRELAVDGAPSSGSIAPTSGISLSALGRADRLGSAGPPPAFVGPYKIGSIIGEGGMGIVYRGVDPRNGEEVAVKTVRLPTRPLFESLRHEIQLLSRTRHAGIVRVLDYDLQGGDPWYAMEFIAGETLGRFIQSIWAPSASAATATLPSTLPRAANGRIPEILSLFQRLCDTLAFLHSTGIVHCDLKPANIVLQGPADPVLMDFGLVTYARGAVEREALSPVGGPRGTLAYVAPEIIRGLVPDPRADFYAVGCMLYEAVTGRVPFVGSKEELVQAHLNTAPTPPSALVSDVPPALEALLAKLLAKDLSDRLGHFSELQRELHTLSGVAPAGNVSSYVFFRPQIAGRSDELAQVETCLERLKDGRGSLVFVSGESGIGKTFFAGEAARRAAVRKVKVIVGECDPPTPAAGALEMSSSALAPLRRYFEFLRDSCREGGSQSLTEALGRTLPTLAPYSPALATLADSVQSPTLSQLPQEAGRERLLEALVGTLTAVASEGPLMLVLDDLQWGDELTLALFDKLRSGTFDSLPLFVLGTYRVEEETPVLRRMASHTGIVRIHLDRLDRPAISSMVRDLVGHRDPESDLVDFVFSHAEGVPFFTAEYLRSIWAEGLLRRSPDGWRLANSTSTDALSGLTAVPLPERLAELIQRRLAGLGADSLRSLEAAAVLGREFGLDVLAGALELAPEEAFNRMEEPRLRQLVVEAPGGEALRFVHDKFRETIYEALPPTRRQALHGRAARSLIQRHEKQASFQYLYGDIARHFRLAGEASEAIDYLERAGERALRISADAEAMQFLTEALELERTLPAPMSPLRRARWERGVAEALHGLGRLAQSSAPLARAAELLAHPMPRGSAQLAFGIFRHLGRQVLGAVRGRPHAADAETSAEMGRVLERVLRISYYTGENLQLLYSCVASLNFCESAGPSMDLATAYINAGATASIVPIHRLARSYLGRAAALLEQHESPVVESQLRMVQGVYHMGIGDHPEAIARIEEGITVAQRIGFHRREDECRAVRSAIDIHAGWHQPVPERCAQIEASARRRGDTQMISWALLQHLECLVMRGALDEADRHLQKLLPLLNGSARPEKIWIWGFSAYTRYRRGERDAALADAEHAAELSRIGPPVHNYCINALDRLAELRMLAWQERGYRRGRAPRELERNAADAAGIVAKAARIFPFAGPAANLHAGTLCWGRGQLPQAISHFRHGAEQARSMRLLYHEARALLALARTSSSSTERDSSRQRGVALLREIDIDPGTLSLPVLLGAPPYEAT